jgi:Concanavalin A-like lectin/glucanases superfamily
MARSVSFRTVSSFGKDPAREFSLLEEELRRKLRADDQLEHGPFNRTQVQTTTYTARPWDIVLCDPSDARFTVVLPDPSAALNIGAWIGVKHNSNSTNPIDVVPLTGTIDGDPSSIVRMPRGYQWYWSDGSEWKHGPSRSEFGAPRVLDTRYAPVGLWNMHLGAGIGIKDYSGNGNDMVIETGTGRYSALHPKLGGLLFDGATKARVNSNQAVLRVLSSLTILVEMMWSDLPAAGTARTIVSHSNTGETSADNFLYACSIDPNNQFTYFSEHGAGVNDPANNNTFAPRSQVALIGLTRSSGGVLNFWYNGSVVGSSFGTVTLPTDGSAGFCRIGGDDGATNFFTGVISSVGVYASELNATQMLERYNYTLGGAYGYR